MQLEEYFEFDDSDRIRLKGTRLPIEVLIDQFLEGASPGQILQDYSHSVSLEQIYATITYYLRNRPSVDAYMKRRKQADDAVFQEHLQKEPPGVVKRLLAIREERLKSAGRTP